MRPKLPNENRRRPVRRPMSDYYGIARSERRN